MKSSMSHHSVLCRDSGARTCVTTRQDAHVLDRGILLRQRNLYRDRLDIVVKKKKKGPPDMGCYKFLA